MKRTRKWFETVVLGLNLCPFAGVPYRAGRVVFSTTDADTEAGLLEALHEAASRMSAADPLQLETLLLIHPAVLTDFDDYNQFLDLADGLLDSMGLLGVMQVASFHPDYRFAGASDDDPANLSNRSPYPMLHLLREQSISDVVDAGADTEAVVKRNINLLRSMPPGELQRYRDFIDSALDGRDGPDRCEPG